MINCNSPELPVERLQDPLYRDRSETQDVHGYFDELFRTRDIPLANGYSFVCAGPPASNQNGFITPEAYTAFFGRRQVPYAPRGTNLHQHDLGHMPAYRRMFSVTRFADVVQTASLNAQSQGEIDRFATAIDTTSAMLTSLRHYGPEHAWNGFIAMAADGLRDLAALCLAAESTSPAVEELHADLWPRLAFDQYERDLNAYQAARS